ncbi:MAG TPA: ribosome biogenesis factor YjgA [Nevskiaceae bacterium]|nr:ribosome biogenesis factor YjgA [Nevskiaceae bacterium]
MHHPRPIPNPEAAARYDGPSKTQLKKVMQELQDLGIALLDLPQSAFDELDLDARLRDALEELRKLKDRSARKRQAQFVGKLMRDTDTEPLRRALDANRATHAREVQTLKQIELWRARLLGGDAALDAFAKAHPSADVSALRVLVREAQRERTTEAGNGKAYRELFAHLRRVLQAAQA